MADSEINITYETLFEILRLEKNRVELQPLDKDFYENVATYIRDKERMYKADGSDEMNQKQLTNIRKIFKDIYFRRQKKMINMALIMNMSPKSVVGRDAMLEMEKVFYDEILKTLKKNSQEILDSVLEGKTIQEQSQEETVSDITIRFIKEVPKFMSEDLESYGPFKAEDVAKIPMKLAKILMNRGSAEEMDM